MALQLPTTKELFETFLANLESQLNQTAPLLPKAFLRVLSLAESGGFTSLYKYAAERVIQNLALTATEDDLDALGKEYKVTRKPAETFAATLYFSANQGVTIPVDTIFIGDSNGQNYISTETVVAPFINVARIPVAAQVAGGDQNLSIGDSLTITVQIAGADTTATVETIENLGVDRETDDEYRRRILNEIRTVGGGSISTDFRRWAEEPNGVFRAFPYSGKPLTLYDAVDSLPGDCTVFVEASTSIDPDGIAPTSLLDEVRAAINFDPVTGLARPALGSENSNLWVESVYRTGFYVEVRTLLVDPALEAAVKASIASNLDTYFRSLFPFIEGLDFISDRNDFITNTSVSTIVQDVLKANGAAAASIGFGTSLGTFAPSYTLGQGETAKLVNVNYVN